MEKREKWAMLLAVTAFVAAYLICCYIPGWRIKLAADPLTYFVESLRHIEAGHCHRCGLRGRN